MDANLINSQAIGLSCRINCALRNIICHHGGCRMQEPDYVAMLTYFFTPHLEDILAKTFPQYTFEVGGVFCHQSPLVSYSGGGKNPELGDLLFVYAEEDDAGQVQYNSLLLQAKIIRDKYPKSVDPNEQHQLYLYQNWPKFTYVRPPELANLPDPTRDIQPKAINDGAQYLLIDPQNSGCRCGGCCFCRKKKRCSGIVTKDCEKEFFMGCAVPAQTLIVDKCLSWELLDFLKFKAGRTFEEDPFNTQDDWTKMIWDLLVNGCRVYNRTKIKHANKKRGGFASSGDFAQSKFAKTLSDAVKKIYGTEDVGFREDFPEGEGGVSVIVIESKPNKQDGARPR